MNIIALFHIRRWFFFYSVLFFDKEIV